MIPSSCTWSAAISTLPKGPRCWSTSLSPSRQLAYHKGGRVRMELVQWFAPTTVLFILCGVWLSNQFEDPKQLGLVFEVFMLAEVVSALVKVIRPPTTNPAARGEPTKFAHMRRPLSPPPAWPRTFRGRRDQWRGDRRSRGAVAAPPVRTPRRIGLWPLPQSVDAPRDVWCGRSRLGAITTAAYMARVVGTVRLFTGRYHANRPATAVAFSVSVSEAINGMETRTPAGSWRAGRLKTAVPDDR